MAKDLRSFIREVERAAPEEILRVKKKVSARYEISAMVMALQSRKRFPILIFEKVDETSFPVVVNVNATRKRLALALETEEKNLVQELRKREERFIEPVFVETGPVKENVFLPPEMNLFSLPIPTHFSRDGGPYLCSGLVIMKDPDTGIYNVSYHRMQLKEKDKLGISLHSRRHSFDIFRRQEKKGEPLQVAIAVGYHPALALGAVAKGDIDTDEYQVIGGLLGEPLELVRGSVNDLWIPARAEIVIEGEILPEVREPEGPFAEFPGYYSGRSTQNVLKVKAINTRNGAFYQDLTPGRAAEHYLLCAVPRESSIFKFVKSCVPTIKGVCMPYSGVGAYHCYLSIDQSAAGQAKEAIFAAFAHDHFLKLAICVDDDIDVYDEEQVLWAVATRMQPAEDVFIVKNVMGCILDQTSDNGLTSKMGIDATKPLSGFSEPCEVPQEAMKKVLTEFGL